MGNSHYRVNVIASEHLAASIVIGTELLDRHVRGILSMYGTVETTDGTVPIHGRDIAIIDAEESEVDKPTTSSENHPESEK